MDTVLMKKIYRVLSVAIVLALLLVLFPATPCLAITETLRPNEAGDVTQLDKSGSGGENWDRVDDVEPDENSTYVDIDYTTKYDLYNIPASSGEGTINFIKVYSRSRWSLTAGAAKEVIKTGGTEYRGDNHTLTGSFQTFNHQWNNNPQTETTWTWDDIDALQIGVEIGHGAGITRCTQVYVEIDYDVLPVVTTNAATIIGETTATLNGNIISIGNATPTTRGFEWDTDSGSPYANDWHEDGSFGTGTYTHGLTSLTAGELYYYRAYAINSYGTGYGDEVTFTTLGLVLWFQPNTIIKGQSYSTGTATFTTDSTAVTGSGTTWTSGMEGSLIKSDTDGIWHVVSTVADATNLTLTENYSGAGGSGHNYTMMPRLPDREGAAHDGTITWGSNPGGVTATIGALLPETQSTAEAEAEADVPEFTPETADVGPITTTGVEGEGFPLYGVFKDILDTWAELGGPNISMPYFWKVVAVVLGWGLGTAVMLSTRNIFFGIVAYFIGFAVPAVAMGGVLDLWVPIVYGLGAVSTSLLVAKWTASSM